MSPDLILTTLKTYGPWGLLIVVLIVVVLKGEFAFRYPRTKGAAHSKKTQLNLVTFATDPASSGFTEWRIANA
jgi:hypothetical protein